MVRRDSEIKK